MLSPNTAVRPADDLSGRFLLENASAPLVRVDDLALVRVTGRDAVTFLHGQFTNAVQNLGTAVRNAGYCTPKGRLLATMRLWAEGDAVMMLVPKAIEPAFIKRLRMYVLRADVTFETVTDRVMLGVPARAEVVLPELGLAVPAEGEALAADGLTILDAEPAVEVDGFCAGGRRAFVIAPADHPLCARAADGAAWWWASDIAAGKVTVWPRTREYFVPQAVNFELTGGVVFNKGCYPGQEVISRVQHIGETSRRAAIGLVTGEAPLPGAPVFCGTDEVGFVMQSVERDGRTLVGFSSLRTALTGRLSLTPEGEPIDVLALPYKVPSAA